MTTNITTAGTGPGAVSVGRTGWDCPAGASLIARISGPGAGRLPAHHGCIYVCPDHQAQAEACITAAGHAPQTDPAPPGHRWNPWPCGHITTYGPNGPQLADALTVPVDLPADEPAEETTMTHAPDAEDAYRWQLRAHRILGELIEETHQNGLPPLTWILARTGALTGEASVLDGPARQRAAMTAWARHLGVEIIETPRSDGRASLYGTFEREGERRGAIRAELDAPEDD